jgi:hypothetical protein
MALPLGTVVLVRYDNEEFHERLVCGQVRDADHVVCTPTFDFFVEQLDLGNGDLTAIRFYGTAGNPPAGVNPADIFRFDNITVAQRDALVAEGVRLTNMIRRGQGIGGVIVWPGGGVAVGPAQVPAAGVNPAAGAMPGPGVLRRRRSWRWSDGARSHAGSRRAGLWGSSGSSSAGGASRARSHPGAGRMDHRRALDEPRGRRPGAAPGGSSDAG